MSRSMMRKTRWLLSAICFGGMLVTSACTDSPAPSSNGALVSSSTAAASGKKHSCGRIIDEILAVKDACRDSTGMADETCAGEGGYYQLMDELGACCAKRPHDKVCPAGTDPCPDGYERANDGSCVLSD